MTTTNFPSGVTSFGLPVIGSGALPVAPTGSSYWFVDSVHGSNGANDGSYDQPYATLAYVLANKAAANDVIVLAAGHAETITAAGTVTANVVGVQIVGLGTGSKRPTFTFTTATTASFLISAAGVSVSNIIGVAGINALTQPFNVTAAGVTLNIEWQDGSSSVEANRAILTSASADKLRVNLKYIGFPAGSSCVNAVRLVGCNDGLISCDFYGKASTAWVEFLTTVCTDIEVYGYMYNSGTTDGSKDIVDTVTGSTWFASINDGTAGGSFSGGSGQALASDDVSTLTATQNVPSADSTANVLLRDVEGNKSDAGVQTVGTTASQMAYIKAILDQLSGAAGITTFPAAAAAANAVSIAEVLRYVSELQVPRIASKVIATASSTLTTGASPVTLFTVTGDVIITRIWGTVQTALTSTLNNGTLAIGVTGNTGAFIAATTMDGSQFPTGSVWVDTTPTVKSEAFAGTPLAGAPIASSANIICTVATNSATAGAITIYVQYLPVSSGASVVAA